MRALGFNVKKQEVVKLVHDVDPHNNGTVDYDRFLEMSESSGEAQRRDVGSVMAASAEVWSCESLCPDELRGLGGRALMGDPLWD